MGRDPLLKGTVVRALKSCGHAQCRCQRGKKHGPFLYLSASVDGRTRTWHIPKGQEDYAQETTGRYKEFRTARERLVKIQKELVQLMNEIETLRREEVPFGVQAKGSQKHSVHSPPRPNASKKQPAGKKGKRRPRRPKARAPKPST